MSAQPTITLYDGISSLEQKTISPYAGMTRLLLNYKKIPFKTIWLEWPEIAPVARSMGAAPTAKEIDGSPHYTIPFITATPPECSDLPVKAISGSDNIALYIEETFPVDTGERLIPDGTQVFHAIFRQYLLEKVFMPVFPIAMPPFISKLPNQEWYTSTRKNLLGAPLEDFLPKDEASIAAAHESFLKAFDGLAAMLDEGGEGNIHVMKDRMCYAELELVGYLNFVRKVTPNVYDTLNARHAGRWAKLMEFHAHILPKAVSID